jgi:hypothetical protein
MQTESFSQTHLEQLAQDPRNLVYHYEHDESAVKTRLGADEAKVLVNQVRQRYLEMIEKQSQLDDEQCRLQICSERDRWRQFAGDYKMIFKLVTNRNTPDHQFQHVLYMLYIMKQKEVGLYTEQQANALIQSYFLKHFTTKKTLAELKKEEQERTAGAAHVRQ